MRRMWAKSKEFEIWDGMPCSRQLSLALPNKTCGFPNMVNIAQFFYFVSVTQVQRFSAHSNSGSSYGLQLVPILSGSHTRNRTLEDARETCDCGEENGRSELRFHPAISVRKFLMPFRASVMACRSSTVPPWSWERTRFSRLARRLVAFSSRAPASCPHQSWRGSSGRRIVFWGKTSVVAEYLNLSLPQKAVIRITKSLFRFPG